MTNKLQAANQLRTLGRPVQILTEEDLFFRLGLEGDASGIHKRFTIDQLGRLLKVPRDRLRAWMRAGLVEPIAKTQGVCYFDFHQVTGVRTLWDLASAGVNADKIRRSLEQLQRWMPSMETGVAQLNLIERDGSLLMRLDEGQLVEATGQLRLDFDQDDRLPVAAESPRSLSASEILDRGCAHEDAGDLRAAAIAYREALYLRGPDATICFNLANVLYELGEFGQAAERFRQAVELDHDFADAWNNLGNALMEFGQKDDAVAAFRRCLEIQPENADAQYNLADALEVTVGHREARRHWKEYLRLEPAGAWADYARRRLACWRGA